MKGSLQLEIMLN